MSIQPLLVTSVIDRLEQALLTLDRAAAGAIMRAFLAEHGPAALADELLIPAMDRIGTGWEQGGVALSQVYMSGRLCETLMEDLLPPGGVARPQPRLAIATLTDYHLLGKRLVTGVLRSAGYEVRDYGRQEVAPLVEHAARDNVQVLMISVLMLPSALQVEEVRTRLRALGSPARIVVGGAPFRLDRQLWQRVGADGVGYTASDALRLVRELTEGNQ